MLQFGNHPKRNGAFDSAARNAKKTVIELPARVGNYGTPIFPY